MIAFADRLIEEIEIADIVVASLACNHTVSLTLLAVDRHRALRLEARTGRDASSS